MTWHQKMWTLYLLFIFRMEGGPDLISFILSESTENSKSKRNENSSSILVEMYDTLFVCTWFSQYGSTTDSFSS